MSTTAVKIESGRERRREGQQPHRAKWSPRREDERDRECEVPRADFVRDVDGRALVGAVDQPRHRERELRDRDGDETEPQRRRPRVGAVSFRPGSLQHLDREVGRHGPGRSS